MNVQQFPEIVSHISEFLRAAFRQVMDAIHALFCFLFTCFLAWQKCMLNLLYLVQSKYAKIQ